jgi:hypothetical protein
MDHWARTTRQQLMHRSSFGVHQSVAYMSRHFATYLSRLLGKRGQYEQIILLKWDLVVLAAS